MAAHLSAAALTGALLGLGALAGCGSEDDVRAFPPAAEPARSPQPSERPAGTVTRIGNRPEGLVADPVTRRVAVALTDPDALAIVDGRRPGRVLRTVPLPGAPRHLRLARDGGPVLVPAESGDRLVEVPLRGDAQPRVSRTGDGPHDAARDAATGHDLVADEFSSTLTILDGGRRVARVPAPVQPGGVAAIEDGPAALVAVRERVLALFDPRTGRRLAAEPAGVGPTHVEAGGDGRVYVADTDGDALLFFRTRPRLRLVRRVALAGEPYGMALDRERGRLWVTLTATNEVVEVTEEGLPRVLRRFPTVRQPNSVAVDEVSGRVFVASRSDGTLQAFDP